MEFVNLQLENFAGAIARVEEQLVELRNSNQTRSRSDDCDGSISVQLPINTMADFDIIEDMLKDAVFANGVVCMPYR